MKEECTFFIYKIELSGVFRLYFRFQSRFTGCLVYTYSEVDTK